MYWLTTSLICSMIYLPSLHGVELGYCNSMEEWGSRTSTWCQTGACYHGKCTTTPSEYGLKVKCLCDDGWTGDDCDTCCDLPCLHGECRCVDIRCNADNFMNRTINCQCYSGYHGTFCNDTLQSTRVTYPDDSRPHDAFLSYRSHPDDERFVGELMKRLEAMGFTLCVHCRDFLPGVAITENILNAVKSSKRTIVVLSPNYVAWDRGEYPRFELLVALQEMMGMKHRIIPIILQELGNTEDQDDIVKWLLQTVTYLTWPGHDNTRHVEDFQERLRMSMPKKRDNSIP